MRPPRLAGRVLLAAAAAASLLTALAVVGLLPVSVLRVASASMEPALSRGDLVLVVPDGSVRRRDVVVVTGPEDDERLVKRVVAVGGDRVAIEDGVLLVDGVAVCEPGIDPERIDGIFFGPVRVPQDAVFLLGDDRREGIDSRDFGPLPQSAVVGRLDARIWPSPGPLDGEGC